MLANFRLRRAGDAQRQRHVLGDADLVDQAKILKYDADPPPQSGAAGAAETRGLGVEQRHDSLRR